MNSTNANLQIDPRLPEIANCLYRLSIKAIVVKDKQLLLVKEQDDEWWSLPGGGVDYGESVDQALRREMSEELGIDPQSVQYDDHVLFVTVGAIVKGIPKACLFYSVQIPTDSITETSHVIEHKWCSADELPQLYLSPSTGSIIEQVTRAIEETTI